MTRFIISLIIGADKIVQLKGNDIGWEFFSSALMLDYDKGKWEKTLGILVVSGKQQVYER